MAINKLKLYTSYPESLYVNNLGTKRTLIKKSLGSLVLDEVQTSCIWCIQTFGSSFPTAYWNDHRYFITFTDHYSRYGYLYLLHEKSQSLDMFKIYKAEVKNQLNRKIKAVRSDRDGE